MISGSATSLGASFSRGMTMECGGVASIPENATRIAGCFCNTPDYCDSGRASGDGVRPPTVIVLHSWWRHPRRRATRVSAKDNALVPVAFEVGFGSRDIFAGAATRPVVRPYSSQGHLRDRARFDPIASPRRRRPHDLTSSPPARYRPTARPMSMRTSTAPSMPSTICSAARRSPNRRHCRCRACSGSSASPPATKPTWPNCITAFLAPAHLPSSDIDRFVLGAARTRSSDATTRPRRAAHDDGRGPTSGSVSVQAMGDRMPIRANRLLLLSGSALALLCLAGAAAAQTPTPEPPPQTTPAPPPGETPQPPPPAPQPTPPTETTPETSLPPVTVTAPKSRPKRTARTAPGAATRTLPPPPPAPATAQPPTTTPAATTTAPFAPLTAITSGQIELSPSQNFGNLFFTLPGATSAGLAPAASRPILRGLGDFRVRIQENGVGSGDVSDLGQDHGVPIDPLAIQKVDIFRGPAALRFGSQAVGGVVEAVNNRIPTAAPYGGVAAELKAAANTGDNGWESGVLLDAGLRNAAVHADFFGRRGDDYRIPSYPVSVPARPRAGRRRAAAELVVPHRGSQRGRLVSVRRRLCRHGDHTLRQRLSRAGDRGGGEPDPYQAGADQDHQQRRVSPLLRRDRRRPLLGRLHRIQA